MLQVNEYVGKIAFKKLFFNHVKYFKMLTFR